MKLESTFNDWRLIVVVSQASATEFDITFEWPEPFTNSVQRDIFRSMATWATTYIGFRLARNKNFKAEGAGWECKITTPEPMAMEDFCELVRDLVKEPVILVEP